MGLVDHLQPGGLLTGVVDGLDRLGHHVHMRLRVDPARDRQTCQLQCWVAVLAGLGIAPGAHDPALHASQPRIDVEGGSKSLSLELVLGYLGVEALRVQEDAMPAHWLHNRYSPIEEQVAQVLHLSNTRPDVVVLDSFDDTYRQSLHVPPCHPAVRVQSLVDNDHIAKRVEEVVVVDGQPPADVDQVVLLGAHPAAIGVAAELLQNVGNRLVRVPVLSLLDEVGILVHAGRIQVDADLVSIA